VCREGGSRGGRVGKRGRLVKKTVYYIRNSKGYRELFGSQEGGDAGQGSRVYVNRGLVGGFWKGERGE